MMSVKGGTQTWSTAAQKVDYKSDGAHNVSAADKEKFFEPTENVGDTLNKVADPNFVESAKKVRSVGNNQLGKDAFMTLLLTQMKNQDPTNPLKSHEMAAQLAQFTSLEKLNNINEGIENLRKDNQPDHNFQALAFIGRTVTMDNSKIARTDAAESHELRFVLPVDAQKANVEVRDATGGVVRTMEMKNLKAGGNQLSWNGKTNEGATAPVGDYTLAVEAFGSNGKKLYVQTKADGVVTGVNFTAKGAQLLMGKQVISLADVKSISDSNLGNQNLQPLVPQAALPGMPAGMTPPPGMQMPEAAAANAALAAASASASAPEAAQPFSAPRGFHQATPVEDSSVNSAPGHHMMPIPPSEPPRHVEMKPETKPNAAKRASLAKGSINDSSLSQGLINNLNKEGAKAGMNGSPEAAGT